MPPYDEIAPAPAGTDAHIRPLPPHPQNGIALTQRAPEPKPRGAVHLCAVLFYPFMARYRKVTIWPLVQVSSGAKVVGVVPLVIPFSTAQATALV